MQKRVYRCPSLHYINSPGVQDLNNKTALNQYREKKSLIIIRAFIGILLRSSAFFFFLSRLHLRIQFDLTFNDTACNYWLWRETLIDMKKTISRQLHLTANGTGEKFLGTTSARLLLLHSHSLISSIFFRFSLSKLLLLSFYKGL